jgi:hypothetical protein
MCNMSLFVVLEKRVVDEKISSVGVKKLLYKRNNVVPFIQYKTAPVQYIHVIVVTVIEMTITMPIEKRSCVGKC